MIEQLPQKLQRNVLEGECRAMEQLHQPDLLVELDQRRYGLMGEAAIGIANQGREVFPADGVAQEGQHDLDRDLFVGPAGKARKEVRAELRPAFGTNRPPSGASPASSTSSKLWLPDLPRVLI